MNWFLFTLIGIIFGSFSTILRRIIATHDEKMDPYTAVVIFQFAGFGIVSCFALINGADFPPVTAHPVNYFAQAVLWGTASYCLFKASKFLEAAEISIFAALSSIITIITAVIFLHEVFTFWRIVGTVLILFSVMLVSYRKNGIKMNKGIWYVLAYSLASGIAITNDAFLLKDTGVFSLLLVGWVTPGIFLLIIRPQTIRYLGYFFNMKKLLGLFGMTLVYALGGIAFYYAIAVGGQASQVNTISQSGLILTAILGALFLKERDNLGKKLLSAIIVVLGVFLLG